MRAVAVIPARMGSRRLPGKVMVDVHGVPLVVHVLRQVQQAARVDAVWVATDSDEVDAAVKLAGGQVLRTTGAFSCGTDRVAAAISNVPADIVLNVQADCAFLDPGTLDKLVEAFEDPTVRVVTPIAPFPEDRDPSDPSIVKAVVAENHRVLYFSRQPIPSKGPWWQHLGVYGFRREALVQYAKWSVSALEASEQLEQLRILENGESIFAVKVDNGGVAVDCPDDLTRLSSNSIDPSTNNSRL